MKTYYVYILRCADDSFYTGITNNLERRIFEHQTGFYKGSYTSTRRPITLEGYVEFQNAFKAMRFERQVKKWSRAKKVALCNNEFAELKQLAECRNFTHCRYKPLPSTPLGKGQELQFENESMSSTLFGEGQEPQLGSETMSSTPLGKEE